MCAWSRATGVSGWTWRHSPTLWQGTGPPDSIPSRFARTLERADRLDRARRPQVVLPALRGGLPHGEGCEHAGKRVRRTARHVAGHDLGSRSSELRGSRAPTEPLGTGTQDLGVGQDLRDEGIPQSGIERPGAGRPGGGLRPESALDEINRDVLASIFWGDRAFISSTMLHGRFSLRLCILNHTTTWDDVRETLEAIERSGNAAVERHRGWTLTLRQGCAASPLKPRAFHR